MLTLVEQLQSLKSQIQKYQDEIDKLFEQHPDAAVFGPKPPRCWRELQMPPRVY